MLFFQADCACAGAPPAREPPSFKVRTYSRGQGYDKGNLLFVSISRQGLLIEQNDDWDFYYERGRRPNLSISKYEATRSEGDYRRRVLRALMVLGAYFSY